MSDLNDDLVDKTPPAVDDDGDGRSIRGKVIDGLSSVINTMSSRWDDYTRDVREEVPDDDDVADVTMSGKTSTPVQVTHVKPVKRARGVFGAFVDGVVGRPHVSSSMKAADGKSPVWTVIKTVVCIFSVIGVLAVVKASVDAFKPRH